MSPRRGGGNWGRGVAGWGAGGAPRSEPPVYTGVGGVRVARVARGVVSGVPW